MKSFFDSPLMIIVTFFILLFVYTKFGPDLPISVLSQQKGEPFVVSAEGKSLGVPNIAKIILGIEESGENLKDVQSSVDKKSKDLTNSLKALGVEKEDIKTTSYNLYPNYDYRTGTQKIIGYGVTITYEVVVRDFEKINDVISSSTSSGANVLSNLTLDIDENTKKKLVNLAREDAVDKAKEKAQGLAKAAGINLGKIVNVSENSSEARPIPITYLTAEPIPTTPQKADIQPGESEIKITVTLTYEVR